MHIDAELAHPEWKRVKQEGVFDPVSRKPTLCDVYECVSMASINMAVPCDTRRHVPGPYCDAVVARSALAKLDKEVLFAQELSQRYTEQISLYQRWIEAGANTALDITGLDHVANSLIALSTGLDDTRTRVDAYFARAKGAASRARASQHTWS